MYHCLQSLTGSNKNFTLFFFFFFSKEEGSLHMIGIRAWRGAKHLFFNFLDSSKELNVYVSLQWNRLSHLWNLLPQMLSCHYLALRHWLSWVNLDFSKIWPHFFCLLFFATLIHKEGSNVLWWIWPCSEKVTKVEEQRCKEFYYHIQ